MITYQDVLEIHQVLIREFGGLQGVRDENGLQSAIQRPFGGFGDMELYPSPEEKAAAVLESIVKNHPFLDGNKRTGYVLMRLMLMAQGKDIRATEDDKYRFVMAVAAGKLDFQQILTWIKGRVVVD